MIPLFLVFTPHILGNIDSQFTILLETAMIIGALEVIVWFAGHPDEANGKMVSFQQSIYAEGETLNNSVRIRAIHLVATVATRRFASSPVVYTLIGLLGGLFHMFVLATLPGAVINPPRGVDIGWI